VSVDVVCAGPVFLDLTFEGLEALPEPGRERFARELHASPGGAAITAIGLARLGLRAAVAGPGLGRDLAAETLRRALEAEGVTCAGPDAERTAVTVVVPLGDERAFMTYEPPAHVDADALARFRPRAVVVGLTQVHLVPADALAYVVVGDRESERYAQSLQRELRGARALFANRVEAGRLTGRNDPEAAALALAEHVATAVVTCGGDGAVAASDGEILEAQAPRVDVRDTTGAGDLLVAAYVWGDLAGLPLAERLRRAVVYAALSVRTATGAASAATLDELRHALAELGSTIANGAIVQTASSKESE
jgi:sugar/nucleoside kinase (ribokinase family)